jgi:predicted ribosome quality control (RQC) complex YloA/Tae2 family protein
MLVLRKYMRGARLKKIEQPPYERILHFHFDTPFGPTTLVIELLGTRSNLLLLDDKNIILGAARLSKPGAGQRVLSPTEPYQPPPPQEKLEPAELTERALRRELDEASPQLELARLLTGVTRGVSPLLAREIVYRATGSVDTQVADATELAPVIKTFSKMFGLLQNGEWQPTVAIDEDGQPEAFAPYPLQHLSGTRPVTTMSEAVESYFADAAAGYAAAKTPLREAMAAARQKLARRRVRLEEDAAAMANPAAFKESGEMILACAHQIQPGQTELVIDWLPGESPKTIKLDPALSPSDNAQHYFTRYRKAQRASDEIPAQLKNVELEESYLEQLEQDLEMAEDRPEIDVIAETLADAGYYRSKKRRKQQQKQAASRYLRLTAPDGARVWVGKNALQNAHLTFNRAAPDDLWLHARNIPGAHIIIPTAEGLPSEGDVFWAAGVAAYYSRARSDTAVEVDVTPKKFVRAIKGSAPGLVTYRNESTLRASPLAPELDEE